MTNLGWTQHDGKRQKLAAKYITRDCDRDTWDRNYSYVEANIKGV